MYFDAETLTKLISDPQTAENAAPAIDALNKRFTSALAVVQTILSLGKGQEGRQQVEQQVQAFLDAAKIEQRDLPPSNKLIEAAMLSEDGDTIAVLNKACADYYEVEVFSLGDALTPPPASDE
ncbi:hypothetical protein H4P12_07500 [Paracoccus sp. 11-3]|uniref:Uncharacterized protein n=1 Tax=Paracoccus amoyensis TaxID=2760093 RepID=A0A926GFT5_9RHOB|nr:hypothetical protein [Paracoccus amoyensis]MBC9246559.1 hypothetical protein [Paracoccus amoyensis]